MAGLLVSAEDVPCQGDEILQTPLVPGGEKMVEDRLGIGHELHGRAAGRFEPAMAEDARNDRIVGLR